MSMTVLSRLDTLLVLSLNLLLSELINSPSQCAPGSYYSKLSIAPCKDMEENDTVLFIEYPKNSHYLNHDLTNIYYKTVSLLRQLQQ